MLICWAEKATLLPSLGSTRPVVRKQTKRHKPQQKPPTKGPTMMYQKIAGEVNDPDIQTIKEALATIRQKLPFLVNLTVAERKQLWKAGESRLSFVENARAAAKNNP